MARLFIAVLIVAAFVAAVVAVALGMREAVREGDRKVRDATMGSEAISRIAFVLLLALVTYVAITGGRV